MDKLQRLRSLSGVISALPTPMRSDEVHSLDLEAFRRIANWQLDNGIQGVVVAGTTGEGSALFNSEWENLLRCTISVVSGKIPVIAGTGTNCTRTTIEKTSRASDLGADAALVVAPYYVKPTQEGLFCHFKTVSECVAEIPIILYNVRGRTACDILPETVKRLCDTCPNILGVKECGGNERCAELRRLCGPQFRIYSGEDGEAAEGVLSYGVNGMISVTAVAAPVQVCEVYHLAAAGEKEKCAAAAKRLHPLTEALFQEPNPTAIKWLMHHLGFAADGIRLPMLGPSEELKIRLKSLADKLDLHKEMPFEKENNHKQQ